MKYNHSFLILTGDKQTKICGSAKIDCYTAAEIKLSSNDSISKLCNCLPACTSIVYETYIDELVENLENKKKTLSNLPPNTFVQ